MNSYMVVLIFMKCIKLTKLEVALGYTVLDNNRSKNSTPLTSWRKFHVTGSNVTFITECTSTTRCHSFRRDERTTEGISLKERVWRNVRPHRYPACIQVYLYHKSHCSYEVPFENEKVNYPWPYELEGRREVKKDETCPCVTDDITGRRTMVIPHRFGQRFYGGLE